ncbi:unnamed protein product [Lepeophtheirus salmonis]|uniref:(salmon louse) hypothetical protein n=1 Tax=Lepeophtheirus salmonis TaxID=72036 RepID=A0A7R8H8B0_LEPSM|nr:unnamed protein product [Lepeophtheirus salmonis]CAF2936617.1 unnamed protein product [Lepeophtheirus salmonis]
MKTSSIIQDNKVNNRQQWSQYGYTKDHVGVVADDVLCIHDGSRIKFTFLNSGKHRLSLFQVNSSGIGAITIRDDVSILAWSDGNLAPNLHVYQYNSPDSQIELPSVSELPFSLLCLNHDSYLGGITGIPELKVYPFPTHGDVFVLTKESKIFKINLDKNLIIEIQVEKTLQDILGNVSSSYHHIKVHFESFIFILPDSIVMAKLDVAPPRLVHKMTFKNPNLNMMNCFEDFAAFNFTGWTKEGHIVRIQTTEYTAKVLKKQIDTKDVIQRLYHIGENIFLTLSIQGTGTIKVFKSQEEVFNCVLNYPVASLFKRLNNSKEFFVGTQDGRWISLQVREDGESGFAIGAVYEMNLNDGPLNICDQDNQCVFVGERGSQTFFFLVDSNKRSIIDNIKIKGNTMEVSIWNILESNGVVLLGSINEQTIHKDTFEEFSFFNLITIVKLKKDNKLVIIQTLDLQSYHSGLILSHNLESFFSFHYGHKSLNEYLLTSEIQCKNKIVTGQQLFINAIKRLNNDFILTASVDGTLGVVKHICPQQQPRIIPLFHFDTGGVLHVDVDELGNVLCLNKRGSIQIFQAPELALKKKKQNKTKYSTENVDFIEIESVKNSKSWISLKIENEKLTQKTIYDKEILYIQTEFEDIKTELNKLWKENKDLPEKDQIEPQAFELNTDELNRRIQEEVTKDELECKKLNTELSDKRSEAIKIKELVWDSMLVKGRSLRGIDTTIIVDNYPLFPITCEEENEFIRYRWQYKKDATNKSPHHFPHPVQQPIWNLDLESQNDKYHDETSDKSNRSGISTLRVQSEKSIDELENNYEIDIDNKSEIKNLKILSTSKKNSIKGHEILRDALKDETSPKECNEDSDNCNWVVQKNLKKTKETKFYWYPDEKPEQILPNFTSPHTLHQEELKNESTDLKNTKFIGNKPEKLFSQAEYSLMKQYQTAAEEQKNRKNYSQTRVGS